MTNEDATPVSNPRVQRFSSLLPGGEKVRMRGAFPKGVK